MVLNPILLQMVCFVHLKSPEALGLSCRFNLAAKSWASELSDSDSGDLDGSCNAPKPETRSKWHALPVGKCMARTGKKEQGPP